MTPSSTPDRVSLYTKLLAFQKEVSSVKKDKNNPFFNSAYFDINGLLAAVKPALNKHGLILIQPLGCADGKPCINTIIIDSVTEESVSYATYLPDNLDAQKMGSAITYYRRYALQSFLGLEAGDDDANLASGKQTKSAPRTPVKKGPVKPAVDPEVPPFGEGSGSNDKSLDDILG